MASPEGGGEGAQAFIMGLYYFGNPKASRSLRSLSDACHYDKDFRIYRRTFEKINSLTDLSGLPYKQYQACAYEIRHHLVKRVLETRFSLLYLFKILKRLALASFAASNAGW